MVQRAYYSRRRGKTQKVDLAQLRTLFGCIYRRLQEENYFREAFGFFCSDDDRHYHGTAGRDHVAYMILKLRKPHLYPIEDMLDSYDEDDLFDVIEFLYDHVSKMTSSWCRHTFCACGGCDAEFDKQMGQMEYREQINDVIKDYDCGYELTDWGEIRPLIEPALKPLLSSPLPTHDPANVDSKVKNAIRMFLNRHSSDVERRAAVRELVDVLEYLRPKVEAVMLKKDEQALFNIANNFAIRHNNPAQKTAYDGSIWLGWMFSVYLASIRAVLSVIKRKPDAFPE